MFANHVIARLLCLALPLILSAPAFAQTTSGSIAGSVVDAQQASIANATVTIVDHGRRLTLATKTDGAGRFVFPQLVPGVDDITVESPGFKKLERKDVELLANTQITVVAIVLD